MWDSSLWSRIDSKCDEELVNEDRAKSIAIVCKSKLTKVFFIFF